MNQSVVVDFDRSVGSLAGSVTLDFTSWQERIRFGCSRASLRALATELAARLPPKHGTVLLGSGDFHHVSASLIARHAHRGPLQVVVCDNHPDNMRFPFGIHCGSWVQGVARLPFVSHVYVLGIASNDVSVTHAWENRLSSLRAGRLSYWCVGVDTRWSKCIGIAQAIRSFDTCDELLNALAAAVSQSSQPIYLSIDKDVLSAEVVPTNWDQGRFLERHLLAVIALCAQRLIGSDISGDLSAYRYRTVWKRYLSRLDGQTQPTVDKLAEARQAHQHLNARLLKALSASV